MTDWRKTLLDIVEEDPSIPRWKASKIVHEVLGIPKNKEGKTLVNRKVGSIIATGHIIAEVDGRLYLRGQEPEESGMEMIRRGSVCLCCENPKQPGKYLCYPCWRRVPQEQKNRLGRRDGLAGVRLLEMNRQFSDGVPPEEIQVSA